MFLPFNLAAWMLQQLSGIQVSDDTIWQWVQVAGEKAITQLKSQLKHLADEPQPQMESLDPTLEEMPLIIATDGVTVPFRVHPKTPSGKIVWREVKIALLARLGKHQTKTGETVTRLHRRRLVAVLGNIDDLKPRLQLEALGQGMATAAQVVWISDGARGFWRLYQECFAQCAIGVLRFLSCRPTPMASCKRLSRRQGKLAHLSSGLPECAINCVTGLASASSKNWTG